MLEHIQQANILLKFAQHILPILLVAIAWGQLSGRPLNPSRVRTPEQVVHALDSMYPGVNNVQWSKKRKTYTADFLYKDQNISITFDGEGHLLTSVEEISFEVLPFRVKERINQFYSSYKIVMVMHRKIGDKSEYDIEVILGKSHYILNYNPKGFLLHQYNVYKVDYSEVPAG